jgi:hypothetical protein
VCTVHSLPWCVLPSRPGPTPVVQRRLPAGQQQLAAGQVATARCSPAART